MKVRELFHVGTPPQAVVGATEFLDYNNCKVINKTKQERAVILLVRRDSDQREGNAYLRVKPQYNDIAEQLVSWAFADDRMIGLTLNEVDQLDTDIQVTSIGGKMMFSRKKD